MAATKKPAPSPELAELGLDFDLSTPDGVEAAYKRMQVMNMLEQMTERQTRKDQLKADRERLYRDFQQAQKDLRHRQRVCQHRKGGKNNKFAKGNAADYSVIQNTYPTGEIGIICTRCALEVRKPSRELKRSDPEAYKEQWAKWVEWSNFPTDNTPSGSKIFEIAA